jgi:LmbE family N-acetylglucosaminyl deacetylase
MARHSEPQAGASGALIVVAHPDDETLWLEPWLSDDALVVVALPTYPGNSALTAARAAIRDEFPAGRMEFLALESLDVLGRSDWRRREPMEYGVDLGARTLAATAAAYRENYRKLCEQLRPYVAAQPVVYTHNPWGEYGHEEHIQVCQAVLHVAADVGGSVWAWDGLPARSLAGRGMRLRLDYYEADLGRLPRQTRRLDAERYRRLKSLYAARGAWTYHDDYEPPETLDYLQLMKDGELLLHAVPPSWLGRATGIFGSHLRRAPAVGRRLVTEGRIRAR